MAALKQRMQERGIDTIDLEKKAEDAGRASSMLDSSSVFDKSTSLIDHVGTGDSVQQGNKSSNRSQPVMSSAENILTMKEGDEDVEDVDGDDEAQKGDAMLETRYNSDDATEEAKEPC